MNLLFQAAAEVSSYFDRKGWKHCVIGGLAVQVYGEIRATQGVDFSLLSSFGDEEQFITDILSGYKPRISDAIEFALKNRVLLVSLDSAIHVDISLGALPFEEDMISRAIKYSFAPEITLPLCTREDLIIMKAFAGRTKDWQDIEGILKRCDKTIDKRYIRGHLGILCELKEDPETVQALERLWS